MRLSDSILISVLVVLLLASILAPKERPEHFYGYNVLGGGSVKWEDAAECSDRAIGFQEDTIGRYWGWQDNASCAFFQFSGGRPNKAQPQAPPAPQQPKIVQYGIVYNAQCGGTGGTCKDGTSTPCVDRPWGDPCAPGGVCERESEAMWRCKERGDKGPSIAQPTEGAGSTGAKAVRKKGQTCGGEGGECGTLNGAGCYDRAWDNWTCESGSSCQRVNNWHWECK
jgi:hypothetical protein